MRFAEITDINDDLLIPWLDLYETAFPPEERVLVSTFLRLLKEKARGKREHSHMLAALDECGKLIGLALFDSVLDTGAGHLWYLAVLPEARRKGVGGALYDEVVRRCQESGAEALVIEVEIPEQSADPDFARTRIDFYRRRGAKLLTGIHYVQTVGPHQPAIPMNILIRPFRPIPPEKALRFVRALFGEQSVTVVGEVGLE